MGLRKFLGSGEEWAGGGRPKGSSQEAQDHEVAPGQEWLPDESGRTFTFNWLLIPLSSHFPGDGENSTAAK